MKNTMMKLIPNISFSGNQLKVIALIAMTCDHVGKELFPQYEFLQIIGRLAFPIFAYMIAEGCRYTKNRRKHLLSVAGLALICQLVYFVAQGSLYQGILVTFSLSICMIYVIDHAKSKRTASGWLAAGAVCLAIWFAGVILPVMLAPVTDFAIDYGIWGILLPVFVYFAPAARKIPVAILALVPLCMQYGDIQWYCLGTVLLLMLYRGKRGKANMKNLFYIYYPAHLVGIYLLALVF